MPPASCIRSREVCALATTASTRNTSSFARTRTSGLRPSHICSTVASCTATVKGPHPHIGLATVTYLFDGRVMHRDSEGNALEITPGAMNLMTAGRGIAHSERSPASARQGTEGMFGIQSWIALPQGHEETAPSFQHFDATSLPVVEDGGVRARIIAGSAFGRTSPVGMLSEWLYAEVLLGAG